MVRGGDGLPDGECVSDGDGDAERDTSADRDAVLDTDGQPVADRETRAERVTLADAELLAESVARDVVGEAVNEKAGVNVVDGDEAAEPESDGVDDVLREMDGDDDTLTDIDGVIDRKGERVDVGEVDGDRVVDVETETVTLAGAERLSVARPEFEYEVPVVDDRETADDADMLGESELERDARELKEELGEADSLREKRGDAE